MTDSSKDFHPCPKGEGCALNKGAVLCKHCNRTWPLESTTIEDLPPTILCPACDMSVTVDVKNCGCEHYSCGSVATCHDYHHGAGVLLKDCLEDDAKMEEPDGQSDGPVIEMQTTGHHLPVSVKSLREFEQVFGGSPFDADTVNERTTTVGTILLIVAIVLFLLAAFGVTLGTVGLIPLGLACMAGGILLGSSLPTVLTRR